MSAAIHAAPTNPSTIVIAFGLGGQMGTTYENANYAGVQVVTGPDLAPQFANRAGKSGIENLVGADNIAELCPQHGLP